MSKMIFMIIFSGLVSWCCTKEQREGWEARVDKISGEAKSEAKDDTLNPDHFTLDQEKQELIGIETAIAKRQTIDEVLELPAELAANPNNVAAVNAPVEGKITALHANLGSSVSEGGIVAVIENPQNLGQRFEVRAPLSGIVAERPVNAGEWIEAGKELMEIASYGSLQAVIRLYPDEQTKVKIGQQVEIESEKIIANGRITFLSSAVDPATRTIEARAEIPNAQHRLKANAYTMAKILLGERKALVVPQSALLNEEAHQIVFVHNGGRYEKRVVEVGIRHRGLAEILSGLKEDEAVVSEGAYQLKNINFTSSSEEE